MGSTTSAGATVILPADHLGWGAAPVWTGTLAEAVRRVMAMTADEQLRASIAVEAGVMPGSSLLRFKDIAELHRRADFPQGKA